MPYPCCCRTTIGNCAAAIAFWQSLELTAEIDPSANWVTPCMSANEGVPFLVPYLGAIIPGAAEGFQADFSAIPGCGSDIRRWNIGLFCNNMTLTWQVSAIFYPSTAYTTWGQWSNAVGYPLSSLVDGLTVTVPFSFGSAISNAPDLQVTLNVA